MLIPLNIVNFVLCDLASFYIITVLLLYYSVLHHPCYPIYCCFCFFLAVCPQVAVAADDEEGLTHHRPLVHLVKDRDDHDGTENHVNHNEHNQPCHL